jgi:hypothetical protein
VPQNSRYGKTAVWGYEEVRVRACAKTCEASNATAAMGYAVGCCQEDLCNMVGRMTLHRWPLALAALSVLLLM